MASPLDDNSRACGTQWPSLHGNPTLHGDAVWPLLGTSEIHLLCARFPIAPVSPHVMDRLQHSLSPDERARAGRHRAGQGHDQFVLGRGLLRLCLGHYLACPPQSISFSIGVGGKPTLSPAATRADVAFNLSHSGDWMVLAFTRGQALGVDIENVRARVSHDALAMRFFAPREIEQLQALPEDQRTLGFFNAWTRKEAYVKAVGAGLQLGLSSFAVTLRPGEPAAIVSGVDTKWQIRAFDVAPDMPGAVVFERDGSTVRHFDVSSVFKTD
jgi:4'-phosphopantetheinyl transferase